MLKEYCEKWALKHQVKFKQSKAEEGNYYKDRSNQSYAIEIRKNFHRLHSWTHSSHLERGNMEQPCIHENRKKLVFIFFF